MYMVTFLNLLPIGQLDGGHVVRSFTEHKTYKYISTIIPFTLIATGFILSIFNIEGTIYLSLGFVSLLLYIIIGRQGHPGVANQYDESKCLSCLLTYLILFILTMPIPMM